MWSQNLNAEFNLKDCLFGNVRITKIADPIFSMRNKI